MRYLPLMYAFLFIGAGAFDTGSPRRSYLKFINHTNTDLIIGIEEACLPTPRSNQLHVLQTSGHTTIGYDVSVASCLLVMPRQPAFGVQPSVFTIEGEQPSLDGSLLKTRACEVAVYPETSSLEGYAFRSSCAQINR